MSKPAKNPGLALLAARAKAASVGARAVTKARAKGLNVAATLPAPRLSLAEFVRQAWRPSGETDELVWGRHLDFLCDALERVTAGELKRLAINLPPGYSKSAIVNVFWPAWEWSLGMPSRFIHAACVRDLATRDSNKISQLLESSWWCARWPVTKRRASRAKNNFRLNHGGSRLALSKGSRATGQRGNRLALDDLHSVMEVYSPAQRNHAKSWFWKEFMSRLSSSDDPVVVIGQRLHEDDIFSDMRAQEDWVFLVLPSEYNPDLNRDPRYAHTYDRPDWRSERGELLHPQRFGAPALAAAKRAMGSFDYSAQHDQRPAPLVGGLFRRDDFKVYSQAPPLSTLDEVVVSVDASFTAEATSDHAAILVVGRAGPRAYLLEDRTGHHTFTETLVVIEELLDEYPGATVLLEKAANGHALDDVLRSRLGVVRLVRPEGSKEGRAVAATVFVEAGLVWVPTERFWPWVKDFLDEVCGFPRARYDDRVDALTQVLLKWYGKKRPASQLGARRIS